MANNVNLCEVLVFALDGQRHAVLLQEVKEIIPAVAVSPLPRAPRFIEGVINLRGTLAPVLNLRERLGRPQRPVTTTDEFVIVWIKEKLVALRTDHAVELLKINSDDASGIQSLLPSVDYGAGIVPAAEGMLILHDLNSLLFESEERALERALVEGTGG